MSRRLSASGEKVLDNKSFVDEDHLFGLIILEAKKNSAVFDYICLRNYIFPWSNPSCFIINDSPCEIGNTNLINDLGGSLRLSFSQFLYFRH